MSSLVLGLRTIYFSESALIREKRQLEADKEKFDMYKIRNYYRRKTPADYFLK